MTSIGLISDTHSYLPPLVFEHFKNCDEIWHAGDFGTRDIADNLLAGPWNKQVILRGVYGNIDGPDLRNLYPEKLFFSCEKVPVFIQHIGGYPGRYAAGVQDDIVLHGTKLFISGHSHILKIMYDDKLNCLHINPGAAGKQGWHKIKTLVRFAIDGSEIKNCEVIELP